MNSCVLMAEIVEAPQLRYTNNDAMLAFAEMWVQFPSLRSEDPPASLRVVGWGKLAQEIEQNYHKGDRVILEGRISMNTFDRQEGFKEKRAELTVQKIHSLGAGAMASSTSTTATAAPSHTPEPVETAVVATNSESARPVQPKSLPTPDTDVDDIPFARSVEIETVSMGLLDPYEIDVQCPQMGSHNFKFV